jgi:hypothetical protein
MDREVGTYVQRERERERKDGRKTNAAGYYTGTHCAQGFYHSVKRSRADVDDGRLFICVEVKGCPYLPPNGVNMKLIN